MCYKNARRRESFCWPAGTVLREALPRPAMADFPPTRASLLLRLRDSQDEEAWRQFVDLYAPLVYGYARKQGLQDADAADLTQQVLGAVVSAIGRLDYDPHRGAFRNWLFTIARHKLANRKAKHQISGSGDSATQQLLERCPDPENSQVLWEIEWQRSLFAWACEQARQQVAETTWQAFWQTAMEDQPGKQVAAALGLSVGAVYLARKRVLARLKELILSAQEP
jgi:RNA polymerase sigma-70 factor (ECF subfamily)